jgi:uncharacterized membrane protein YphA (DoxX/SURF4 family)
MKKTNILYWIFTIVFAGMMLFTAIPNVTNAPDSVKFMHDFLGYPLYFIPFIGVVKVLGVIAILIPGYPRIKEWAYAGLFFDLIGAVYSVMSVQPDISVLFMLMFIIPGILSYVFYRKKETQKQNRTSSKRNLTEEAVF